MRRAKLYDHYQLTELMAANDLDSYSTSLSDSTNSHLNKSENFDDIAAGVDQLRR